MLVKHAIFPVAGLGTRFLPATKALPKEMLPIVDKPLVQYAVEEAYAAGIRQMIFVTGRHKRAIEDHFDLTFELEDALEKSSKAELLAIGARGQAGRHGLRLRPPGQGARPRPCGAVRPPGRRRPSLRRGPARRPDDRHAADPGADGGAVRGEAGLDHRGAGGARASTPVATASSPATPSASGWSRSRGSSRSRRRTSRLHGSASPAATC